MNSIRKTKELVVVRVARTLLSACQCPITRAGTGDSPVEAERSGAKDVKGHGFQVRRQTWILGPCLEGTNPLAQDPANSPKHSIWTPARIGCTIAGTRAVLAPGTLESRL